MLGATIPRPNTGTSFATHTQKLHQAFLSDPFALRPHIINLGDLKRRLKPGMKMNDTRDKQTLSSRVPAAIFSLRFSKVGTSGNALTLGWHLKSRPDIDTRSDSHEKKP